MIERLFFVHIGKYRYGFIARPSYVRNDWDVHDTHPTLTNARGRPLHEVVKYYTQRNMEVRECTQSS